MFVRHAAAILFAGLAFVTPAIADTFVQESDLSLDLREGELPAPVSSYIVSGLDDAVVAELPVVDIPGPLADLSIPENQDAAQPSQAAALPDESSSAIAMFAERDDSENFSWLTADLAGVEDMTTGSLGSGSGKPSDYVELTATPSTSEISSSADTANTDGPVIP